MAFQVSDPRLQAILEWVKGHLRWVLGGVFGLIALGGVLFSNDRPAGLNQATAESSATSPRAIPSSVGEGSVEIRAFQSLQQALVKSQQENKALTGRLDTMERQMHSQATRRVPPVSSKPDAATLATIRQLSKELAAVKVAVAQPGNLARQPPPRVEPGASLRRIAGPSQRPGGATRAPVAPPAASRVPAPPQARVMAGCFANGKLLTGLLAPVRQGQKPLPALVAVTSPFTCGPGHEVPLKGCLMTAEGKGILATRRAETKVVTLSCVLPNGQAFEEKIDGAVFANDAYNDLIGEVFEPTGEYIVNTALATALSLADAYLQAQSSTAVTGALFRGGSTAIDQLVSFYLNEATKPQPFIRVKPNQDVRIVLREGFSIPGLAVASNVDEWADLD